MKTIRVKYVGFWDSFDPQLNVFTNAIMQNYNVVECDNPDYIICSVFGKDDYYDYCKYNQVRIMYSGENYIPDFNLVDYAVSTYPIDFQDRHFRYPICFDNYNNRFSLLLNKDRNYSHHILDNKIYFANFIASHESEDNIRGDFFNKLSEYKRVESFGSYLNNQKNGEVVDLFSKSDQQKKCKFTLCFESTRHEGFVTEKITDAFFADTIPIYYGSSDVKNFFNENAFIYCDHVSNFDKVINRIIELDNNDEKYLEMLREPIFKDIEYAKTIKDNLDSFIRNIFDQPLEKAFRRSKVYSPSDHETFILELKKIKGSLIKGRSIPNIPEEVIIKSLLRTLKRKIRNRLKR